LVVVTDTILPVLGLEMPFVIRSCPPDGIAGISKLLLKVDEVIKLLEQVGGVKDVALELADSRRVMFSLLYWPCRLS